MKPSTLPIRILIRWINKTALGVQRPPHVHHIDASAGTVRLPVDELMLERIRSRVRDRRNKLRAAPCLAG